MDIMEFSICSKKKHKYFFFGETIDLAILAAFTAIQIEAQNKKMI